MSDDKPPFPKDPVIEAYKRDIDVTLRPKDFEAIAELELLLDLRR